jgi:hypothetical protein
MHRQFLANILKKARTLDAVWTLWQTGTHATHGCFKNDSSCGEREGTDCDGKLFLAFSLQDAENSLRNQKNSLRKYAGNFS